MATLLIHEKGHKNPLVTSIFRKITTLGSDPENDIVISDDSVESHHAQIVLDGDDFVLSKAEDSLSMAVNGKERGRHILRDGDVVALGEVTFRFSLYDETPELSVQDDGDDSLEGLQRLASFSERLMAQRELDLLLNTLLDEILEATNASKGFLILQDEEEALHIKVARNIDRKDLPTDEIALSDSIVAKVVRLQEPMIVSDALNDTEFGASVSVVNLKLCSVMCTPLIARGEFLGLLYLGNDNVVNLFTEHSLEVLRVFASQAALLIQNAMLLNELELSNQKLREELDTLKFGEIIGVCNSMKDIFHKIEKIATADISVLVQGETGTGKELIANEIHARGNRSDGPFIVVNCGAIPENLLESELFGHVRGAFTGAVATVQGRFQAAHGGTLFLDEIGELPLNLQVKLLRAIQERSVTKVGDTRSEKIDVRFLTATNRNLQEEVRHGRFREDLFYRLNVITLQLPPLRDRGEDVILIARYLLQKYAAEFGSNANDFDKNCIRAMRKHKWPGNIRELENRIKKAVVFADGKLVKADMMDLQDGLVAKIKPLAAAKEDFQRLYIDKVLAMNDGNRTKTAKDLAVDPRTIFRHLEKSRSDEEENPGIASITDEI